MKRYRIGVSVALLAAVLAGGAARAADRDAPADLSGLFGLNGVGYFHYRDNPDAAQAAQAKMDFLKRAGAAWDRFDFWWGEIEPQKGTWKWDKADWLVDFYTRNRIQMLPILCYGAAWRKESPSTPEDFADFAEYVGRVVARYKDRVRCWEIWNEPNIPTFWKPQPDPVAYTRLLKAAYAAAHRADPRCIVVGAAANETDINWLRDIAKDGGLKCMDAVSIHPYSMSDGPEQMDLARQLRNVRTFLRQQGRPDLPVWITEMGWMSALGDEAAMDRAGRCMWQSYVIAASEGVERLFWFNLQDWNEGGHLEGWGLISPEMKPKKTLAAYRRLADTLAGAQFAGYLPVKGGAGYVFRRGGKDILVVWARRRGTVALPVGPQARATDIYGGAVPVENGRLLAGDGPVTVEGAARSLLAQVSLRPPAPETDNLIVNPAFEEPDAQSVPYGWHRGMFYGGADKGAFGLEKTDRGNALTLRRTEDAFWQSWPVPAMPGERYTLTAEVKTAGATGENGVQILFLSGPGWGWKGGPVSPTATGTTGEWKTVTVTGTVPDDADVVRVNLVSKNNTGTVLFRSVRLTRLDAP
jgi:hypothetical protein